MTNTEQDDYVYALSLQSELLLLDEPTTSQSFIESNKNPSSGKCKSLVDPEWELIDPNPDVHTLFMEYNKKFFWGRLDMVSVRWSPRMTLCAGVCCYEGEGGLCSIRLSKPLLSLRPRKDLVETLLHEMIHAYLFVTKNNRDRDGHGPEFCKHMNRINNEASTNISIYHSFHDEVDEMRKHWWRCGGACRTRPPYFGYVKRAMNRAPSKNDNWWASHQETCGGSYVKVKEPENYGKKKEKAEKSSASSSQNKNSSKVEPPKNMKTIDSFMKTFSKDNTKPSSTTITNKSPKKTTDKISGKSDQFGGVKKEPDHNPRGIPFNSRLLSLFSSNKTNATSQNIKENMQSKIKGLYRKPMQSNATKSQGKPLTPLEKVCQRAKLTGIQSVNAGSTAIKQLPVVTKFLTEKEKRRRVIFSSDDESSESFDKKDLKVNVKNNSAKIFTNDKENQLLSKYKIQNGYKNLNPKFNTDVSKLIKNEKPGFNGLSNIHTSLNGLTKSQSSKRKSDPNDLWSSSELSSKKIKTNTKSEIFTIDSSSDEEGNKKDFDMSSFCKSSSMQDQSSDSDTEDELYVCSFLNKSSKNLKSVETKPKNILKQKIEDSDSRPSPNKAGSSSNFTQSKARSSSTMQNVKPETSSSLLFGESSSMLKYNCPVCNQLVPAISINSHVDNCLTQNMLDTSDF